MDFRMAYFHLPRPILKAKVEEILTVDMLNGEKNKALLLRNAVFTSNLTSSSAHRASPTSWIESRRRQQVYCRRWKLARG